MNLGDEIVVEIKCRYCTRILSQTEFPIKLVCNSCVRKRLAMHESQISSILVINNKSK